MTAEIRAISDKAWAQFVSHHSQATIFHHPAWASLLAECYGYRPFVLVSLNAGGEIEGGMPIMEVKSRLTGHRWVSLPFSDFCTPLSRDRAALDVLVEYLVHQNRQRAIPRVEIHAGIPDGDRVFHTTTFVWSKLRLRADPEALMKTFDRTRVRLPVQAAARRGVEVREGTSKSDIDIFYDMFAESHRRLGAPVQPKRFFNMVWDQLIEKRLGFLLLAYKDSVPIAGTLYLHHGSMLTAKYNGSVKEYQKLRPNNLLMWSGIKWGCEHGDRDFDFGRTEVDNHNLRDYKKGWGAEEEPLAYATISDQEPKEPSRRSREILGAIIRRSPRFVCRFIGEILYGHYA